jgi:O-antigen ligase
MQENWQFGIGPGQSDVDNPWTAAHQMAVNQGSEIGVIGFLSWIALSLLIWFRFLRSFFARDVDGIGITLLVGPAFYLFLGMVANVSFSNTVVNPWAMSLMLLLGLNSAHMDRTPA